MSDETNEYRLGLSGPLAAAYNAGLIAQADAIDEIVRELQFAEDGDVRHDIAVRLGKIADQLTELASDINDLAA